MVLVFTLPLYPMEDNIKKLFEEWAGEAVVEMHALAANGSNRQYWRLSGATHRCIATFNNDVAENEAFFSFTKALYTHGILVPEVYLIGSDRRIYLQQDLGDETLYSHLYDKKRKGAGFDLEMLQLYKQALGDLARMQVAGRDFDYQKAYPRTDFDAQSIMWDLNYFKYYFLKMRYIPFDENLLEQDFHCLTDYLLEADCKFFMYRDFQSRNIMLCDGKLYYIDYQGGRRGAAQYDVASLLYSAKSDLPERVRQELLDYYITCLAELFPIDKDGFRHHLYGYVLIRILQTLGAYGYRGLFERKDYFLSSIPLALKNLRSVVENHPLPIHIPHLRHVLQLMIESDEVLTPQPTGGLTVTVASFSYKNGIPRDPSGNGGGFVFDCRALPNPGRSPEYRQLTGRDRPVIKFLEGDRAVEQFLTEAERLVGASIVRYMERNFTNLMVCFGCTGGRHRSVYCAERVASWIKETYDCHVVINHTEG